MANFVEFDWGGERLTLLPERAIWWPRRKTLLVADLHIGKDEVFRNAAIPIPTGSLNADLRRLSQLIERWQPIRLMILGDFSHRRDGISESVLCQLKDWKESVGEVQIELILGNHDKHLECLMHQLGITVHLDDLNEGSLVFSHFPASQDIGYRFCGHVHPAVMLRGDGRQRLRLRAFWFSERLAVLPAFGSFTGSEDIQPNLGDHVFVIADDEVIQINVAS